MDYYCKLIESCKNIYVSENNIFQDKICNVLNIFNKYIRNSYVEFNDLSIEDLGNVEYLMKNKFLNLSSALFTVLWIKIKREWKWNDLSYSEQLDLLKDYIFLYINDENISDYEFTDDDECFTLLKHLITFFDKRCINNFLYNFDIYDKELEKFIVEPKSLYELTVEICKNNFDVNKLRNIIPKLILADLK